MSVGPIGKCYKCGANLYATLGLCTSCELVEVKAELEIVKNIVWMLCKRYDIKNSLEKIK